MEIPRHWRLKQQRYALIGEVCPHCEAKNLPPARRLPGMRRRSQDPIRLQRQG